MTFYSELADSAAELLAEFGRSLTLTHVATGAYDVATGTTNITETTETGTGALFDFGLHQSGRSFAPGTMIQAGDKQLLLAATVATSPASAGRVTAGSDVWSIVAVKTLAPAGETVLYECLLRK